MCGKMSKSRPREGRGQCGQPEKTLAHTAHSPYDDGDMPLETGNLKLSIRA